ncbi:MAG TPA: hypothetical protein VK550_22205 [Polyangiaceae bacterium]|nr:hypothetical protein [Polyangiaceae bacterium]
MLSLHPRSHHRVIPRTALCLWSRKKHMPIINVTSHRGDNLPHPDWVDYAVSKRIGTTVEEVLLFERYGRILWEGKPHARTNSPDSASNLMKMGSDPELDPTRIDIADRRNVKATAGNP